MTCLTLDLPFETNLMVLKILNSCVLLLGSLFVRLSGNSNSMFRCRVDVNFCF